MPTRIRLHIHARVFLGGGRCSHVDYRDDNLLIRGTLAERPEIASVSRAEIGKGFGYASRVIEVTGLVFSYAGAQKPALSDLEFSVEPGEVFGFLGPNGAGKSTTQKVLTGLLRDYRGVARVLEREVRDWGSDLYEHVGVGFELPVHYGRLTARENLRYFASLYEGETEEPDHVLEQVDPSSMSTCGSVTSRRDARATELCTVDSVSPPAAVSGRADHRSRSG